MEISLNHEILFAVRSNTTQLKCLTRKARENWKFASCENHSV